MRKQMTSQRCKVACSSKDSADGQTGNIRTQHACVQWQVATREQQPSQAAKRTNHSLSGSGVVVIQHYAARQQQQQQQQQQHREVGSQWPVRQTATQHTNNTRPKPKPHNERKTDGGRRTWTDTIDRQTCNGEWRRAQAGHCELSFKQCVVIVRHRATHNNARTNDVRHDDNAVSESVSESVGVQHNNRATTTIR